MKYIIHYVNDTASDFKFWYFFDIDGISMGRAYISPTKLDTIYLDELHVSKEWRGNGIGTKLQEVRESLGRDNGCKFSSLSVTNNTWQKSWYERRGYKYSSDHQANKNDVWMRKKL